MISGVTLPREWNQYNTQTDDGFELVHVPKWDTQNYASTATLLSFGTAAAANLSLGNLVFPLQNSYLVKAIGLYFKDRPQMNTLASAGNYSSTILDDHVQLVNQGVLTFQIGEKNYGPFPAWKLSPGAGIYAALSQSGGSTTGTGQNVNYSQLGFPSADSLYTLAVPLVIPAQTRCSVSLVWPAGGVTTSATDALCLCFEGIEARPIQ